MQLKLKLASLVNVLGLFVIAGFAVVILTSAAALRELKVGGPVYDRIVMGKDLVADILPPPAYVMEAYVEATLAMQPQSDVAAHKQALAKLQKAYDERQAFWRGQDIDSDVRRSLTVDAQGPGQEFWKTANERLLPALEAGNAAAAQEGGFMMVLWIVSGGGMAVAIFGVGVGGLSLGMIRPIRITTGAVRARAGGDANLEIPVRKRAGEIAQGSDDLAKRTERQAAALQETTATQAETSPTRISAIIAAMEDISLRTKQLALDSAVEAACAGEAGKGLAAAAQKVRALADRSRQASQQIRDLIAASGREVAPGVKRIGAAGLALARIIDIARQVAEFAPAGSRDQAEDLVRSTASAG